MKEADDKRGKRHRSKTDNTNGQQKPWLFKPGQSGNPLGAPRAHAISWVRTFCSNGNSTGLRRWRRWQRRSQESFVRWLQACCPKRCT
jgi:hypothetical protein